MRQSKFATIQTDCSTFEQNSVIKFLMAKKCKLSEIYRRMCDIRGELCVSCLNFGRYVLRPSSLSKFLRRSLMIYIIKGFQTIAFILIVISTTFRPICTPAFFRCFLSKFLRRSLMIYIIKGFQTIAFILIVISTTFRPICTPAFFRCFLSKFL